MDAAGFSVVSTSALVGRIVGLGVGRRVGGLLLSGVLLLLGFLIGLRVGADVGGSVLHGFFVGRGVGGGGAATVGSGVGNLVATTPTMVVDAP